VTSAPSGWRFLRVWLVLGLQSFGGGMATLALVRRVAVEQERWVTAAEFSRFWALVQLAPGINLLALIILIGRKAAGARGICLALLGLLLPSVALTVVSTALYARGNSVLLVREAAGGIIPAIVGLGLVTAWQIARPLLAQSWLQGWGSLSLALALLAGSGLAAWRGHQPVILILGVCAALSAAWNWAKRRAPGAAP